MSMFAQYLGVSAKRGQKMASDPLELELQVVVRYLVWVLKLNIGCSGKASSPLNH